MGLLRVLSHSGSDSEWQGLLLAEHLHDSAGGTLEMRTMGGSELVLGMTQLYWVTAQP